MQSILKSSHNVNYIQVPDIFNNIVNVDVSSFGRKRCEFLSLDLLTCIFVITSKVSPIITTIDRESFVCNEAI